MHKEQIYPFILYANIHQNLPSFIQNLSTNTYFVIFAVLKSETKIVFFNYSNSLANKIQQILAFQLFLQKTNTTAFATD